MEATDDSGRESSGAAGAGTTATVSYTCPSIIHALIQILDSYFYNGLSSLSQKLHATQKTQLTTHNPHKYHANAISPG